MRARITGEKWLLLLGVLLLATGLRFYRLEAQSFWNDEGNSARLSERSLRLIIEGTASDIHPPLYYIILRGWRELVGEHEFGLRSFSAFAGVLTVAANYALAVAIYGRRSKMAAMIAAGFAATNPALVYYSQETRMYALLALIGALSTWFFLRWQRTRRRGLAAAYVLSVVAGLYTHYFFPAVLVTHGLIVVAGARGEARRQRAGSSVSGNDYWRPSALWRRTAEWLGLMAFSALFYSPWLPIFLRQAGGRPGARTSFVSFFLDSFNWMAFGGTIVWEKVFWPLVAIVFMSIIGLVTSHRRTSLPLTGVSVPVILMFAAGTTQPEFYKFLLVAVPFLMILVALSWRAADSGRRLMRPLLVLAMLPIAWAVALSLHNLYFSPAYARADYRGIAARIAAEARPNAAIILSAPNQWEVFTYYYRQGAPVYPLPKGRAIPERIDAELTAIAAEHDLLYALFWGERQRDPQGLVEKWLDTHAYKATEEWVGEVRFATFALPSEPAEEAESHTNVRFGDWIRLDGFQFGKDSVTAGDILPVTLFWETAAPLNDRYKVFLHLVNDQGEIVAQRDGEPGGGNAITTGWTPGETVVDNHGILIPAQTLPGQYTLLLGLYELFDPSARLPATFGSTVSDSYLLATVRVD